MTSNRSDRAVRELIADHIRRAETLRQIHSNKGAGASKWSRRYLMTTVVLATVVTTFGFVGSGRLAGAVSKVHPISSGTVDAAYTLVVLAILVTTLLGLVCRFDERSANHYRSIEILTEYIRDYEDLVALSIGGVRTFSIDDLNLARTRYKGILMTLPPNTDKEYLKAKKSRQEKKKSKDLLELRFSDMAKSWRDDSAVGSGTIDPKHGNALARLMTDDLRLPIFRAVRRLGEGHWVTGGVIREAVWDHVHNFTIPTPLDDVDVVYFDSERLDEQDERERQQRLRGFSPNVNWSVKNEARMHKLSSVEPFSSLEDAIAKFPETASSVAVRLDSEDRLHFLAPHGLADLFDLKVRPTPGFDFARFKARVKAKAWSLKWPKIEVGGSEEA